MSSQSQPRPARWMRGNSTLTLAVILVLAMVALVGVWQAGWLGSGARARNAADLVALAAARAQQTGRPACEVAAEVAHDNAAELIDCEVITGWGEFVVDVTVEVPVVPKVPGAPDKARASSRAGVVAGVG